MRPFVPANKTHSMCESSTDEEVCALENESKQNYMHLFFCLYSFLLLLLLPLLKLEQVEFNSKISSKALLSSFILFIFFNLRSERCLAAADLFTVVAKLSILVSVVSETMCLDGKEKNR